MCKLYLYGYFDGTRSSRKLERECHRNVEVMWLLNNLKPDFKTIADFRKDNLEGLTKFFKEFSRICDELKLFGKEMVAVDGSKFRANNSRRKNYTKRKLKKQFPKNDGNNYIYRVNAGSGYVAQATTYYNSSTGIVVSSDININTYYSWANSAQSGAYDVWSVFVHESGHTAGLGHSSTSGAVMYITIS